MIQAVRTGREEARRPHRGQARQEGRVGSGAGVSVGVSGGGGVLRCTGSEFELYFIFPGFFRHWGGIGREVTGWWMWQ